jgi:hypothetical protein
MKEVRSNRAVRERSFTSSGGNPISIAGPNLDAGQIKREIKREGKSKGTFYFLRFEIADCPAMFALKSGAGVLYSGAIRVRRDAAID